MYTETTYYSNDGMSWDNESQAVEYEASMEYLESLTRHCHYLVDQMPPEWILQTYHTLKNLEDGVGIKPNYDNAKIHDIPDCKRR